MIRVIAHKGVKVPTESKPNEYITDDAVVEVENTLYYRRRIADGDLIEQPAKTKKGEK